MKFAHSTLFAGLLASPWMASAQQPLTFTDVFDFKSQAHTQLSDDGKYLAFTAKPYRGDVEGMLYNLDTNTLVTQVALGEKPQFNATSQWVAFTQNADLLTQETTKKADKKKLKKQLTLVNTQTGQSHSFSDVKDFQLSDDGLWLAFRRDEEAKKAKKEDNKDDKKNTDDSDLKADKDDALLPLILVNLSSFEEQSFDLVNSYGLSNVGLIWQTGTTDNKTNQVRFLNFAESVQSSLITEPGVNVATFSWHPTKPLVAFTEGNYVSDDAKRRDYQVRLWNASTNTLSTIPNQQGWYSAKSSKLKWSDKGERLFFNNRPYLAPKAKEYKYSDAASLRDFDTIRAQKGLKVWHHQDPEIKPREINQWNKENKNRQYQAVYHLNGERVVQLSGPEQRELKLNTEADALLVSNDTPYLHETMYNGFFADHYRVNVATGDTQLIVKKSRFTPSVSPKGNFAAYFDNDTVWLKNLTNNKLNPLSKAIKDALFSDDKHDYPSENPGFGIAGWLLDESEVLVYSKFDIWAFNTKTFKAKRLTDGKASQTTYRVKQLDKQATGFAKDETLLLSTFNEASKETGVATLNLQSREVKPVLTGESRFDLVLKAKHSDKLIYTAQSYHQFPDFWQTSTSFERKARVTDLNPQLSQFAWGEKPELVQYKGFDGEDLQGVLIKPAGYQAGQKVPVVIYFYRYMSDRRYDFPKMELNHRPNFPMFTSNGYAVFLPDIRFEIGHPGKSSTQTMINAANKLIELGIADPNNIGLQGHSWAGYQSAFMITQTDMFKAVVSGAPVSNMTSAYSGIRLGSGLARQFQYETGQSRIGKTLFEAPELYIENSPVFFADKVNTPIMIMFGNEDDAVPYQEGIQYYLALRRAGKDVIFVEYEGEPHHLKKFPNQLDFSIRMMEYFDHHLKGMPAPSWMQQGEAFTKE